MIESNQSFYCVCSTSCGFGLCGLAAAARAQIPPLANVQGVFSNSFKALADANQLCLWMNSF